MQRRPLALAIGIALAASSTPTLALTISTTSAARVQASGLAPQIDGPGGTAHASLERGNLGETFYSIGSANVDTLGNSNLVARATENSALITSNVHQVAQITNSSNTAQNLSFNFLIPQAYLETTIMYFWDPFTGSDFERAAFSADILLNGVSIWGSAANLRYDNTGITLSQSGTDLGLLNHDLIWMTGEAYKSIPYNGLLNLGIVGANSTITLEYLLTTTAETNTTFFQALAGYGAIAKIGDPFTFNNTPFFAEESFLTTNVNSSVPEPSGLGLVGAGLAALAFRRKTRKK